MTFDVLVHLPFEVNPFGMSLSVWQHCTHPIATEARPLTLTGTLNIKYNDLDNTTNIFFSDKVLMDHTLLTRFAVSVIGMTYY